MWRILAIDLEVSGVWDVSTLENYSSSGFSGTKLIGDNPIDSGHYPYASYETPSAFDDTVIRLQFGAVTKIQMACYDWAWNPKLT